MEPEFGPAGKRRFRKLSVHSPPRKQLYDYSRTYKLVRRLNLPPHLASISLLLGKAWTEDRMPTNKRNEALKKWRTPQPLPTHHDVNQAQASEGVETCNQFNRRKTDGAGIGASI